MRKPRVSKYLQESLAPSTHRAYASDLKRFIAWGGRIPATSEQLVRYLSAHAGDLKAATLNRYVASVAHAHTVRGLRSPLDSKLVRSTLRGIRRVHGSAQKQAKPLLIKDIKRMVAPNAEFTRLRNVRDKAVLLIGFAGAFRRSELASILVSDLTFSPKGVVIRLRASKTDPSRKGRDVAIPASGKALCPVRALKTWLRASQDQTATDAENLPVFRRIDKHGYLSSRPLHGGAIGFLLRARMQAVGMDSTGYSAHSLRAGFVTSAARAGTPTWAIQRQTGHRSEQMVHRYIRDIGLFEANATAKVWAAF